MKENELEFSDWPMFDLLMTNEELCRELLEVVLDAPVSNIEYIIAENDIRPTLTNHGVRLDAYVKTENEVCNIEMQTVKRAELGRRLRFYQGAMDTLALRRGEHYRKPPSLLHRFHLPARSLQCGAAGIHAKRKVPGEYERET